MTAYEYGKKAFENGKIAAPALDQEFVAKFCNGPVGSSLPALNEWTRGWHAANLAAPVEV